MGCEEENYQKNLHDLFLVWNLASITPLLIGERGHERTQHPTDWSNVAHQKSSSNRTPLFNARGPSPACRATSASVGVPLPYDPPTGDGLQRGEADASTARRRDMPADIEIPRSQPSSQSLRPTRLRHARPATRQKLRARTDGWDAPTETIEPNPAASRLQKSQSHSWASDGGVNRGSLVGST